MSQDREVDQYLQGKSEVSRTYAELPPVKLPDHLDAAILAEAHRAVGARPGNTQQRRWAVPLSLVATLFVVVMVGLQWPYLSRDAGLPQPAESPAVQDKVAAVPAPVAEQPQSKVQRKPEAPARERAVAAAPAPLVMARPDVLAERKQLAVMPPPAAPAAAAPAMAAAPAAANELAAAKAKREGSEGAVIASEAYRPAPQAAPAAQARAAQPLADAARGEAVAELPQHWLERIAKLKQQGRLEEAGKELAAFRKHYPDYVVPPALQGLPQPAGAR